jgi:hypothetical protein
MKVPFFKACFQKTLGMEGGHDRNGGKGYLVVPSLFDGKSDMFLSTVPDLDW